MNGVISPHDEEDEQCQPCSNSTHLLLIDYFNFFFLFKSFYCFCSLSSTVLAKPFLNPFKVLVATIPFLPHTIIHLIVCFFFHCVCLFFFFCIHCFAFLLCWGRQDACRLEIAQFSVWKSLVGSDNRRSVLLGLLWHLLNFQQETGLAQSEKGETFHQSFHVFHFHFPPSISF